MLTARKLTTKQRKIIQAYADDVEGRTPDLAFLDSNTGTRASTSSRAASDAAASDAPHPDKQGDTRPFVDPQPTKPKHDEWCEHEGVGEKVAHAIGGALGWAERLFGRLTKDADKKDEKK